MSAPIRVPVGDDQFRNAQTDRSEKQTLPDSELTPQTSGQLISEPSLDSVGTRQENRLASTRPVVVRRLKDPPEIWDLVHETPAHFNPTGAFVARLTSSKRKLGLIVLSAIFISGLAAFVFTTRRDGPKRETTAPQVTEDTGTSSAGSSARQVNRPADGQENSQNGQVSTSPGAESVVDNSPLQPTTSTPTDSQPQSIVPSPDNAVLAAPVPNDGVQPTGMTEGPVQASDAVVNNMPKRTSSRGGRGGWSRNNRVAVTPGGQTPDNLADHSSPTRAARSFTAAKSQTSQASKPLDLKQSNEKGTSDPPSANKESIPTLSPQLIAPPTTTSAPKAKVIQWP